MTQIEALYDWIMISVAALGVSFYDETQFPNPSQFDPDRFSPDKIKHRPSTAFSPFGFASRRCPGYKFSRCEAVATLSVIVRKFLLKPAFEDDFFIEPSFGLVTTPDTEIWLKVEPRVWRIFTYDFRIVLYTIEL